MVGATVSPAPSYFKSTGKGVTLAVVDPETYGRAPNTTTSSGRLKAGGNYAPTTVHLRDVQQLPGCEGVQQLVYSERQAGQVKVTETGASSLVFVVPNGDGEGFDVVLPKSDSVLPSVTAKNLNAVVNHLAKEGHPVRWICEEFPVDRLREGNVHGFACGTASAATLIGEVLFIGKSGSTVSVNCAPKSGSMAEELMRMMQEGLEAVREGSWKTSASTDRRDPHQETVERTMPGGPTALFIDLPKSPVS
jgi:branched-subunit amino acid aminotransferase/4-amino-4-deoxychorismate lyase